MYKTDFNYQSDPAHWTNDALGYYSTILYEAMNKINCRLIKRGVKPRRIEPSDLKRYSYEQYKKCVSSTNSTHT